MGATERQHQMRRGVTALRHLLPWEEAGCSRRLWEGRTPPSSLWCNREGAQRAPEIEVDQRTAWRRMSFSQQEGARGPQGG